MPHSNTVRFDPSCAQCWKETMREHWIWLVGGIAFLAAVMTIGLLGNDIAGRFKRTDGWPSKIAESAEESPASPQSNSQSSTELERPNETPSGARETPSVGTPKSDGQ